MKEKQEKDKYGQEIIKILVTTEEYLVRGDLHLPVPSVVDNPTTENLLFYVLNCGNMFISLHNCVISNKKSIEYKPEEIKYFNINLNIVHSCQIIEE